MPSHYCERCGPGLFDEPLNALTNVSFFVAAGAAWLLACQRNVRSVGALLLIALAIAVGVGSTLWHTFATPWARYLDVVPIFLFQLCFLWLYSRNVMGLRPGWSSVLVTGFVALTLLGRQFANFLRSALNGAPIYAPAVVLSLALGLYHHRASKRERFLLLAGAAVFLLALVFRTIDLAVCPYFPVGTHFLWHLLTGAVSYLAMRSLIVNPPNSPGVISQAHELACEGR